MNIDEKGNVPLCEEPALVLLSGGFDSVAALAWTVHKHKSVRALVFDYGQPHRDAEACAAGRAAEAFGVPLGTCVLADALHAIVGTAGLLGGVVDHSVDAGGINTAYVPGRNLVFLSSALAHAMAYWPAAFKLALVVGFCREDAGGFPDCSEAFVESAARSLSLGAGRTIIVSAPWVRMSKAGILTHFIEQARSSETVALLQRSWSCYRGGPVPCGRCTACMLRTEAFRAHDMEDLAVGAEMRGGDVHRDRNGG